MALIYDANGYVIGDDGNSDTDPGYNAWGLPNDLSWDSAAASNVPQSVDPTNVSFFQSQMNSFQSMLNSLDASLSEMNQLMVSDLDAADQASIQAMIDEFSARKAAFRYAATAYNYVANTVAGMGGTLPSLTIPQSLNGLGFLPAAIPIGYVAAIATAAVLIGFGLDWLTRAKSLTDQIVQGLINAANASTDPTEQARLLNNAATVQAAHDQIALQQSQAGAMSQIANIVKYLAIAAGIYFAFDLYTKTNGKRR